MIKVSRKNIIYRFAGTAEPVVKVKPGDRILFETLDAHSGTMPEGAIGADVSFADLTESNANPVSGLVYIEGTEANDTLAVKILKIDLLGPGFIPVRPKAGIVFDMAPQPMARIIHIKENKWFLNHEWSFPVRPMIGTIGTAVPGPGIATMYSGDHGGNIDNNFVREGATVYLPVKVPGALLGLGDVHASMGDAEASGGGIDICANVTVEVNVIKGGGLSSFPYIEYNGLLITCGHGSDIESAIETVTKETIRILAEQMKISSREAYQLISALGDVNISQACNCLGIDVTTRVAVPIFWSNKRR